MRDELRIRIVDMITKAGEGHIPSSFSIVDIIDTLYSKFLKFDKNDPKWPGRDYFVLSKGHGCAALFVVLEKHGLLDRSDIDKYGTHAGILGGHPDRTKVPGVEASTGSLGHGLPFALGLALGQKIQSKSNKVIVLVGDGECHEGTVWEAALVAQNLDLRNICCVVDYNGSAAQILPHPNIQAQWEAFGWTAVSIDGHNRDEIEAAFASFYAGENRKPFAIIARNVKGRGVSFLETHGPWHHKIPGAHEYAAIIAELSK